MAYRLPLIVCLGTILSGCVTSNSNLTSGNPSVFNGQSKAQIATSVGQPVDTQFNGDIEVWGYCTTGFFSNDYFIVVFKDETVIGKEKYSIGGGLNEYQVCEGSFRTIEWNKYADRSPRNQNKFSDNEIGSFPPVTIREPKPSPPSQSGSSGSGFFVSKMGHVVTNAHVVKGCKSVTVGDNANTQSPAEVISTDERNDLALLKLSSLNMASAETKALIRKLEVKLVPLAAGGLLRSEDVELGEKVMVAGYPYGDIFSNTIKVSGGIVSASRGMGDDTGQFQMDAAVQPGNSGGPIYDENGNIVGVVVSQLNKLKVAKAIGSMPENVNFGIKASTVRQFLTSSGLPSKWSERNKELSNQQLAKTAEKQTLMVVCFQ